MENNINDLLNKNSKKSKKEWFYVDCKTKTRRT
jgi:hypothetical protein